MITVAVLINGRLLFARSAVRLKMGLYELENHLQVKHQYEDGAIVLAKKLLDTIPVDYTKKAHSVKDPCILFPDRPK